MFSAFTGGGGQVGQRIKPAAANVLGVGGIPGSAAMSPRDIKKATAAGFEKSLPATIQTIRRFTGLSSGVRDILDAATAFTNRRVTADMIRSAARHCGIDIAAQMFGLAEVQVCEVIIARRPRRSRGISAADLRRTRATIRKVINLHQQLRALSGPHTRAAPRRHSVAHK